MAPEEALEALTDLARSLDVEVRIEPFTLKFLGKGGLCRIEGRKVVLIDAALGAVERAGILGLSLGKLDLRAVAVPRTLIPYLRTGHGPVHRVPYLRPLARA